MTTYRTELHQLAQEIDLITSDIQALRDIYKECDNIAVLQRKIKELEKLILHTDLSLHRSMASADRIQKAKEIGYLIRKTKMQTDLDNMRRLEQLHYTLQDKEEIYLFKKHKLLRSTREGLKEQLKRIGLAEDAIILCDDMTLDYDDTEPGLQEIIECPMPNDI